jgi:hypothetical protein
VKVRCRAGVLVVFLSIIGAFLAACSNANPASVPVPAASAATPETSATEAPTEVSDFPAGVYRSQLTVAGLAKLGLDDPSTAGIWTFTVHPGGAFELTCRPVADPGVDCGNGDPAPQHIVEVGNIFGTSPTMWFVLDPARLMKLTGCICGPQEGYHLSWAPMPDGRMAFSNFVGLGERETETGDSWTIQPWTRIS